MSTQVIGPYQVVEVLGEGGMGQVLKGFDPKLQREVAIKVLHPALVGRTGVVERSYRELQVLLSLQAHPNIVTVFDYVPDPFAIVMEFLRGETLDAVLAREGALAWDRALRLMRPVLEAVGFAHEKGILHRDIKAANVMIVPLGTQEIVKVMDFGLAGFVGGPSGLTRSGTRMGTPAYMAPEQHLGRAIDERTDVYALGVLLYLLCSGRLPFPDSVLSEYELARAHIEQPVPGLRALRPDVPPALEQVVLRAMQKAQEHRYPTCADLALDLQAVERGQPVSYGLAPGGEGGAVLQPSAPAGTEPPIAPPVQADPPAAVPVTAVPEPMAVSPEARRGGPGKIVAIAGAVAVVAFVAVAVLMRGGSPGPEAAVAPPASPVGGSRPGAAPVKPEPSRLALAASASSATPSRTAAYDPYRAVDGDPSTWWQEADGGDGIQEWLKLDWNGEAEVRSVRLVPGYWKDADDRFGDRWVLNNRLKRIRLELSSGPSREVELPDQKGWHSIPIDPPVRASWMRVVIQDVYPGFSRTGQRIRDSGVGEIEVWGVR